MLGRFAHRLRARECGVGIAQFRSGVDARAVLAGVAVLVLGAAYRTFALDIAIGKEHALHRIVELLYGLRVHEPGGLQLSEDVLRQLRVLGRVCRMPVVVRDVKAFEIAAPAARDLGHESLGRLAGFLGGQHDRSAVRVVGADEMHGMAVHALKAHPDVGLDVLHDVADVKGRIGVRQRRRDEERARRHLRVEKGKF